MGRKDEAQGSKPYHRHGHPRGRGENREHQDRRRGDTEASPARPGPSSRPASHAQPAAAARHQAQHDGSAGRREAPSFPRHDNDRWAAGGAGARFQEPSAATAPADVAFSGYGAIDGSVPTQASQAARLHAGPGAVAQQQYPYNSGGGQHASQTRGYDQQSALADGPWQRGSAGGQDSDGISMFANDG